MFKPIKGICLSTSSTGPGLGRTWCQFVKRDYPRSESRVCQCVTVTVNTLLPGTICTTTFPEIIFDSLGINPLFNRCWLLRHKILTSKMKLFRHTNHWRTGTCMILLLRMVICSNVCSDLDTPNWKIDQTHVAVNLLVVWNLLVDLRFNNLSPSVYTLDGDVSLRDSEVRVRFTDR